jgi:FlaG/FlaF family flagellin (archaellin)
MVCHKGASPIISYVLAILLAIIVIAGVASMLGGFYDLIIKDEIRRELTQVVGQTSSKITEIYSISKSSKASPANGTSILLAEMQLNIPDQVSLRNYRLTLLSASQVSSLIYNVTIDGGNTSTTGFPPTGKILAETTQDPTVKVDYDLPSIDVDVQGWTTDPGNATLKYYRYNVNGTVADAIVLGNPSLIVHVLSTG